MAWRAAGGVLTVAGDVASAFGCPVPAQTIQNIVEACEATGRKCKQLANRCRKLLSTIEERQPELQRNEKLREEVDALTNILYSIHDKIKSWPQYNRLTLILKRRDIEKYLDDWNDQLDLAIQDLHVGVLYSFASIIAQHHQQESHEIHQRDTNEMLQLLSTFLSNQQDMQQLLRMQQSGENVAAQVMEVGQLTLAEIREHPTRRASLESTTTITPLTPSTNHQIQDVQHGLVNLHNLTGIPPYIKILDGEVRKDDEQAIGGGSSTDIWRGTWMGERAIALKSLRNVKADDAKAQKRFRTQIELWSQLQHENILPFYGIVTNMVPWIHIVTPLQENRDVLHYVKNNPSASKQDLLIGAARGVAYLHSREVPIVHGNLKCTNILVDDMGHARIADFGMAKIVASVTGENASYTLSKGLNGRWIAPELIRGQEAREASDVWSFGMVVLELMTEKQPYAEQKNGFAVIVDISTGKHPRRPEVITDGMWAILQRCWAFEPQDRPAMGEVAGWLEVG
ncbi:kinase-like domain-containing protein [Schizophyllum commune]